MRSLKVENEKLKKENLSMNETVQSTILTLQSQMTVAMTTALEKKTELEKRLAAAECTIQELSDKLRESENTTV
jgi:SMC interacting uncharacterized protein involved in chromosome segregation